MLHLMGSISDEGGLALVPCPSWLGSIHDGLRVIVKGMTTAMSFVSTSAL
jgi:hypothetical protein